MNKVLMNGRIVNNVEMVVSEKGTMIFSNSLAVKRDYKNAQGEYDSDFVNIVAFGNTAKFLADYTNKGDAILVEGRIGTRNYTNKEGVKVYVTEVLVDRAEITAKKQKPKEVEEETDGMSYFDSLNEISDNSLPF